MANNWSSPESRQAPRAAAANNAVPRTIERENFPERFRFAWKTALTICFATFMRTPNDTIWLQNALDIGDLPSCRPAAIVTACLLTVAAYRHVAPKAAGIAATVDKQPTAIGTDPQPRDGVLAQQRQRRDGQRRLERNRRR